MPLYDVKVMNEHGVWFTDTVTSNKVRAQDRGRFLIPRVPATKVEDHRGERVWLDDERPGRQVLTR